MKSSTRRTLASTQEALSFPSLMVTRHYEFRTLQEAKRIALEIAKHCPNPPMAAMGLLEIFINAIEHGNLKIDFKEKSAFTTEQAWFDEIHRRLFLKENIHKQVLISLEMNPMFIRVMVQDEGEGFSNPSAYFKAVKSHHKNGRGILIAKKCGMDDLIYHPPGNLVECLFYLNKPAFVSLPAKLHRD